MNIKERTYNWKIDTATPNLSQINGAQNLIAKNRENTIIALIVICNNEYGKYFLIRFVQPNIEKNVFKKIMKNTPKEYHESNEGFSLNFVYYETGLKKALELTNKVLQSVGFILEEKPKIPKKFQKLYSICANTSQSSFEEFIENLYVWKKLTPTVYSAVQFNKENLIFISINGLYLRINLNIEKINKRKKSGFGELIRLITTLFKNSEIYNVFPRYKKYADYLNTEWSIGPFEDSANGLEEIQHVLNKVLHELGFILYPHI